MKRGPRITALATDMARTRRFVLYVAISLGILAIILWIAVYEPQVSLNEFHIWYSFVFFTILLAVLLAGMYWRERKNTKLWLLLAGFMAVHTGAYVAVLLHVSSWLALWYIPACVGEGMLFILIAKLALNVLPSGAKL